MTAPAPSAAWTWEPYAFVLGALALILLFEVKAFPHKGGTISEGVWAFERWARINAPYTLVFVGFIVGVFFGHLFYCPAAYYGP